MTTVYVTHDQREALTMSDRIAVVNHGRIMQLATPQGLYEQPANRFVADFIGDSTFLSVERHGDQITYNGVPLKTSRPVPDAASLVLMLRPERVRLATKTTKTVNEFQATASELVYQGDSYLMYATMPDGTEISLRGAIRQGTVAALPKIGDHVTLALEPGDTVLIDGRDV
jgi:putative spermidine/putrescine transport system ATP-binding protein